MTQEAEQEKTLKRMDQPKKPVLLVCPKCQGEYFIEWTHELRICMQRGILLFADGDRNYETADKTEAVGETVSIEGYECETCHTDVRFDHGQLIEEE